MDAIRTRRVAIYTRVSTSGQTTANQLRELRAAAERLGHQVVAEFTDEGISGAKGRKGRPGLSKLLDGVTRRDFDKVMAWSVDRLGRSLPDLLTFMGELKAKGVDLYLHQQALDTSTPAGKAMFQMLGVFSEFEREIIRERVNAGLARATAPRRMPPPWSIDEHNATCFIVRDRGGQSASLLLPGRNEPGRRSAAKLPDLLLKG
jgi:DNA invertase Pin-like site-specific DNA recombinase